MLKVRVFDNARRTDMRRKMLRESVFTYLNRSAQRGSAASRVLIEAWLARTPAPEHAGFRSRFRCGKNVAFTSALQELTLHELLRLQGCELRFHPEVPGTTNRPDFSVRESGGLEFLLEACTSTEISTGPEVGPRADRIRDFLRHLQLPGYRIVIDELTEGDKDLPQKVLGRHIDDGIKTAAEGYTTESISIPLLNVDGWRIKLTVFPTTRPGTHGTTVMYEAWSRTSNGPSYPLRDLLNKKGGRYGDQLAMPYVIAVNSSDFMLTARNREETLFGARPEACITDSRLARGFWGTSTRPNYRRVSAVLFTQNLCEPTLLMGHVYARLYLNPWADKPYGGVLTKLPTFRFESGTLRECAGMPLHKLLKLRLRDTAMWG